MVFKSNLHTILFLSYILHLIYERLTAFNVFSNTITIMSVSFRTSINIVKKKLRIINAAASYIDQQGHFGGEAHQSCGHRPWQGGGCGRGMCPLLQRKSYLFLEVASSPLIPILY